MEARKIGIILVTIGLVLLVRQFTPLGGEVFFIALSLLGLGLYWQGNRSYGLLLGSLILGAVGLRSLFNLGSAWLLTFLGLAFIGTWLVHTRRSRDIGPLIPGLILLLLGISGSLRFNWVIEIQGPWIPLTVAVVFGIAYALRRHLGLLIPAVMALVFTIITMLPRGMVEPWMVFGGLALGFVAILLIHTIRLGEDWGDKYWPVFPAAGLTLFALVVTLAERGFENLFLPLFLGIPALVLLIIYATGQRHLGLLIPGLMLGSVATWFALGPDAAPTTVSPLLFMFSASFFLILLLETRKEIDPKDRWWPAIPGTILGLNGALIWAGERDLGEFGNLGSSLTIALILIGVGILVILSGRNKIKAETVTPPAPPESEPNQTKDN